MQVKTFTGKDTMSVLAQIKAELGTDAIILSTRHGKGENGPWCEMTAGLERGTRQGKAAPAGAESANGNGATPSGWNEWHKEWSEIKEHLVALMKPGMKLDELTPRQRVALEYLEREGVEDTVLMALFRRLKDTPGASVLAPLADMVPVKPWGDEEWYGKFHALAGPYGAGKTSTAVRLGLDLKRRNPDTKVCIVNADCERGNGRLFLRHYAELTDIAYHEVTNAVEFAHFVRESAQYDKVLVDLPGLSRDAHFGTLVEQFGLDAAQDYSQHLVISPSYGSGQLNAFLRQYATARPGSIIWTKLDEACTFGAVVNVAVSSGRPVSALSFGPGLKNTLVSARDVMLWRMVFKHQLPGEVSTRSDETAV